MSVTKSPDTNISCMFIVCLFCFQEFVVQHNENANPPTFFLTLDVMLQLMAKDDNVVRCGGGSERGGGGGGGKGGREGGEGGGGGEGGKGRRGGGGGGGGKKKRKGNVKVVKHGMAIEREFGGMRGYVKTGRRDYGN